MKIYASKALFPVSSPPLEWGAIVVEGSRIIDLGKLEHLIPRYINATLVDLRKCAILPGLVNAHAHLEYTLYPVNLSEKLSFVDWLIKIISLRRDLSQIDLTKSLKAGIQMLISSGTTCVGVIVPTLRWLPLFQRSGIRATLFQEVIGYRDEDSEKITKWIGNEIRDNIFNISSTTFIGISPHSPYTVSPKLYRNLYNLARDEGLPFCTHLSESTEEIEFISEGKGDIAERLFPLVGWGDINIEAKGVKPARYLSDIGVIGPETIVVHAVNVGEDEIDIFRARGSKVVTCPRSNHYLAVGKAPIPFFLQRGLVISIGTDGLSSNTSLSLWDEMRFLKNIYKENISPDDIIRAATIGGAKTLGWERQVGSLEVGKEADFIAIDVSGIERYIEISEIIENTDEKRIKLVVVAGKILLDRREQS